MVTVENKALEGSVDRPYVGILENLTKPEDSGGWFWKHWDDKQPRPENRVPLKARGISI